MGKDFVTLQTFDNPVAAHMARNYLAEAGVRAFLANEGFVSTVWYLSNAAGGIQLLVAAEDAQRAGVIFADQPRPEVDELLLRWASQEEEDIPPTSREVAADRAFRVAVIAIMFEPLQFYVVWLLWKVITSTEELQRPHRLKAVTAGAIAVPYVIILILVLWWMIVDHIPETYPIVPRSPLSPGVMQLVTQNACQPIHHVAPKRALTGQEVVEHARSHVCACGDLGQRKVAGVNGTA